MTLIRSLIVITLIAFAFSSCKKDDSSQPPTADRIKTYTEAITSEDFSWTATYNLSYDNEGRLISATDAAIPGNRFAYTHSTNGFDMDIYVNGNVIIHEDVFLSNNRMDSTFQYNDEGDTTTEKYNYNPSNQMVKLNRYTYSNGVSELDETVNYTYDANNNITSEISNFSHTEYEYNEQSPDIIDLFPLYYSPSQKLPSRVIEGGVTLDHTYTLDSKNRLVIDHGVYSSGEVVTRTFTYE
jgi:hypothetical protein